MAHLFGRKLLTIWWEVLGANSFGDGPVSNVSFFRTNPSEPEAGPGFFWGQFQELVPTFFCIPFVLGFAYSWF